MKRLCSRPRLAWLRLGTILALPALLPGAPAADATGGPGDPVPEFRGRDPWLPYPADTAQTVRALARRPDGGWWIAGSLKGGGLDREPSGLWTMDPDGRLVAAGSDAFLFGSQVTALHRLADGGLLVGGQFALDPSRHRPRVRQLARLLPNGRLNPAFPAVVQFSPSSPGVLALAPLASGGTLVGGEFRTFHFGGQSVSSPGLVRLLRDGLPDPNWNSPLAPQTPAGNPARVNCLVAGADGAVWVGGDFVTTNGRHRNLLRLTPAGDVDVGFRADQAGLLAVRALAEAPDGALWVSDRHLARLLPDGRPDPEFPARVRVGTGTINALLPEADTVWLGGRFSQVQELTRTNLARVDRRGRVLADTPPAALAPTSAELLTLAHGEDGALVAGGSFLRFNNVGRPGVAWLARDGTVDVQRLRTGLHYQSGHRALVPAPDGGILLAGSHMECHGWRRFGLLRLRPDGGVDPDFDSSRGMQPTDSQPVQHVILEPDGKVVTPGTPLLAGGTFTLMRLRPDGSLDPAFGPDGRASSLPDTEAEVSALLRLPDGSILVAGRLTRWGLPAAKGLYRLQPDGRADPGFVAELPPAGTEVDDRLVTALALEADGRMLVGGPGRLARLEPDGRLVHDLAAQYPPLRQRHVTRLLPGGDGTLVAETYLPEGGVWRTLKLLADGSPEPTFLAPPHRLFGAWPDERLLLGSDSGSAPARLLRAFPNGRLDGSFGVTWTNFTLRLAAVMPDGSVAAALSGASGWSFGQTPGLVRLRADAPSLSRFRLEPKGGVSFDASGSPGAELRLEVSSDWQAWTEVLRRRMPASGHDRWHVRPGAWWEGPAAFYRLRRLDEGGE